jgi:hypothetical protein
LKPEQWRLTLVQEKYLGKRPVTRDDDDDHHHNNVTMMVVVVMMMMGLL